MAAQLDATSVIHAPLPNPYSNRPTTTAASGSVVGVQSANMVAEANNPMVTKTFQTPNLSAMRPARTRPKNEPTWRITTE